VLLSGHAAKKIGCPSKSERLLSLFGQAVGLVYGRVQENTNGG
jgi:hypothetical protein